MQQPTGEITYRLHFPIHPPGTLGLILGKIGPTQDSHIYSGTLLGPILPHIRHVREYVLACLGTYTAYLNIHYPILPHIRHV